MTGVFVSNFMPVIYTARKMLEMQQDELKLKKDFKVKAFSIIESRFPSHYELYVETDDHKQFVQLLEMEGQTELKTCSKFTSVLPPGGK